MVSHLNNISFTRLHTLPGWTWTVTKTKIDFVCLASSQIFEEPVKTLIAAPPYIWETWLKCDKTDTDNRDLSKQRRLQRQFNKNISHMLCFFWTMTSVLSSSETGASLILLTEKERSGSCIIDYSLTNYIFGQIRYLSHLAIANNLVATITTKIFAITPLPCPNLPGESWPQMSKGNYINNIWIAVTLHLHNNTQGLAKFIDNCVCWRLLFVIYTQRAISQTA